MIPPNEELHDKNEVSPHKGPPLRFGGDGNTVRDERGEDGWEEN